MIRELIIGVSVAVIGVGAHAATAQAAAAQSGGCSWGICVAGECPGDGGWQLCRDEAPANCHVDNYSCLPRDGADCLDLNDAFIWCTGGPY